MSDVVEQVGVAHLPGAEAEVPGGSLVTGVVSPVPRDAH